MRLLVLPLLVSCVSVSEPFSEEVDAAGITRLRATVDRGGVEVRGDADASVFQITGTSTGRGTSRVQAAEREAANAWTVSTEEETLVFEATSGSPRAGVDVRIAGPPAVDLDVVVEDGLLAVTAMEGRHRLVASQVLTTRLTGEASVHATRFGMDVEVYPWSDGQITLTSEAGDVILRVPLGGAYDVEVLGDEQFDMFVTDFGFVQSIAEPGYFQGIVGDGSIPIRVTVQGGRFEMLVAY